MANSFTAMRANILQLLYSPQLLSCLIGAIIRIVYCIKYPVPVKDSYKYSLMFQSTNTEWWMSDNNPTPPLAIFLLNIPHSFFHYDFIRGGIVVNTVIGLLIICIFVKISLIIIPPKKIAFGVGLLGATHPTLIHYSCQPLRENTFLLFYALAAYNLLKYYKKETRTSIAMLYGGICIAAAVLCRHEGIELFLIYCLVIVFFSRQSWYSRLCQGVVLMFSTLLSFFLIGRIIKIPSSFFLQYIEKIAQKYLS